MDVLENFERWKEFLGEQVNKAHAMGMSEDQVASVAKKMGDYLANKVDPKNEQERLLKQMWDVGDEQDRHALAKMMIRMSEQKVH
ncbi:DUF3243 domain-containing protein [Alicyclobacillus herbarius]|uniref:DUF3243 domain-containing protein n=1 Tax=Alicyclobacillus herbarius TaxID=122960 RepID=UPI000413B414|nr:DUF3243 domain-containing protein [Alicyclobacillus herbarius]